jgi:hypothetical protein
VDLAIHQLLQFLHIQVLLWDLVLLPCCVPVLLLRPACLPVWWLTAAAGGNVLILFSESENRQIKHIITIEFECILIIKL